MLFAIYVFFASLAAIIGLASLLEEWQPFDALYMTVITLGTVGFKKVSELLPDGKLFTIFIIISGTGLIAHTLNSLFQFTLEGQLRKILGRKKLANRVNKLSDHYIICGFGRMAT